MSSAEFLALYNQGQLDDGENMKEKAEWSAACQIKEKREKELALLEDARSADSKAVWRMARALSVYPLANPLAHLLAISPQFNHSL